MPPAGLSCPLLSTAPSCPNWPKAAKKKPSATSPAYEGQRQSSTSPHDRQYKSDGSNYPSPSRSHEQASRPLFSFNMVQPYTHQGGELRCMCRKSYLELIAFGGWGHQFHRVPRQMAHWRQVQSTNCRVLIGLQGGVDLEVRLRDVRQTERLKVCTGQFTLQASKFSVNVESPF